MNTILPIITVLFAPSSPLWVPPVQDSIPVETVEVLSEVRGETEVDRRVREILNAANARYWKRRVHTKTLPGDRWTPQQAGWIDASGRPLVVNWPWWAW